ncbi:MAG: tetratricopeptide repeat protein [Bacteroidetes bacterium]|nr:MAG: tetratricopeptide repeat protein [Bacteroidota bacterium]
MKRIILISLFMGSFPLFTFAQTLDDAKKLTENEQYDAASSIYKQLISREPDNGTIFYYYGENLLLSENVDSAKVVFKNGLNVDPSSLLLKIGEAKILLDFSNVLEAKSAADKEPTDQSLKSRYEEARTSVATGTAMIQAAVAAAPSKSATVYVEAADAFIKYKNKNLEEAKKYLDKALAIDPKNVQANILFGDLYGELNNGSLAAEFYNKALDLNLNSARAIVSKGRLYKRSTNYDGAALEFENAIQVDPNYAPAYRELGETQFKQGKLSKAKENYKKYLELSKNNCSARIRYASFLYLSKDYSAALTELGQVEKNCDNGNLTLLRVYAYCYYETKDYAKGLQMIQKLFDRLPENKRAAYDYEYYGKILVASDQDSIGILQLRKAYNLDPNRTDILSDISNAYYKVKNYTEAANALNEKIAIGKDVSSTDYYMLGRSYFFNAQFAQADTALAQLNEKAPTYANGWLWRAKANANIDSTSELGLAKPHYEKYIEIAMADSANISRYQNGLIEAYGYLAYFYILHKDNANALLFLQKKAELPLEPEEKKSIEDAINQLKNKK